MKKHKFFSLCTVLLFIMALTITPISSAKAFDGDVRYKLVLCTWPDGEIGSKCKGVDSSGPCDKESKCSSKDSIY